MQKSHSEGNMYAIAMLVSGTFCTVIMKAEYSIISEGTELCINPSDPSGTKMTSKCPFDKPWFGVLQMKLAMSFCLVFLYLKKFFKQTAYLETPLIRLQKDGKKYINTPEVAALQRKAKRSNNEESTSLLRGTGTVQEGHVSLKTMLAVSLPSLLDLIQTVLANVGLLWISSSVFQMARGSMIVFSAFFSVTCMHKRLFPFHYVSILIVTISVVLVGMAGAGHGTEQSTAQSSHALLGLLLIILAQVFCAMQIVVEEHLMISLNVSPMLLVGLEGLWGLLFYIILVPILTLTPHGNITPFAKIWHEDFYDSFVKIKNSNMLWWMIFIYIIAVGTLNVTANYVTKHLSAVVRSIVETLRTLGVWVLGLFVYYVIQWKGTNSPGEAWTVYSWMELLGFALMVYGTLTYKKIIKFPFQALYTDEDSYPAVGYKSPFMASMHK